MSWYQRAILFLTVLGIFGTSLVTVVLATPLAGDDVVIIVRSGTNADGTERFDVADSGDFRAVQLWTYAHENAAVRKVLQYYRDVQSTPNDASTDEERAALSYYGGSIDPIYIEVEEGGAGAYCDWKARFTVELPNGQTASVASPKVVIRRNDALFTGGDTSLQVQTLVHEIGHAVMSKQYGYGNLPQTEWLGKEHAGGVVSDEKLALIEGWAEFIGAYFTDRLTIANDPADAMRDNRYAYTDIYTRTTLRSAADMLKTEGWVATALLDLVTEGAVSLTEMDVVLKDKRPQTFHALVLGLEERYPSKSAAIRTVLADTSKGQLYTEYRVADPSSVVLADTVSFTGRDTSGDGDGFSRLLPGLVGAVLGAMAGGPFGAIGLVVGAATGFAVGRLLSEMLETTAAVRPPAAAGEVRSTLVDTVAVPAVAVTTAAVDADMADLRAGVDEAFEAYVSAVRQGTRDEQLAAMNRYRTLHAAFRARLSAANEH